MTDIFTIELLPARYGDAIWIEYGDAAAPHRILIDGGAAKSSADVIRELMRARIGDAAALDFELIVLTHIDADHITGLLRLFEDAKVALHPRDVWFNAWQHLPSDLMGAKQAERLSTAIRRRKLPWNADFGGGPVRLPGTLKDPNPDSLPDIELPGGMHLTLLSPTYAGLARLRPVWQAEVDAAGLTPGGEPAQQGAADLLGGPRVPLRPDEDAKEPFKADPTAPNGSSIAFLAEYDGRSALLTGDAHAPVLETSIATLIRNRGHDRLPVDAVKLAHHGSKYNLSPALLALLDCRRFLVSTDGTSSSRHPDPVGLARIVTTVPGAQLEFNYASEYTTPWSKPALKRRYGYETVYPGAGEEWLTVRL